MEHTNKIKQERIQIAMMIGIYLAIIFLLVAIILIWKNIEEIKTDPIVYGLEKQGYTLCSCYDVQGNKFNFNGDGYIQEQEPGFNLYLDRLD